MTIRLHPDVAHALARGQGVVALESTLICHGLPRPHNASVAVELEQAVRARAAVPATVAAMDGQIKVGLSRAELGLLVAAPEVAKCTTRDLPRLLAGSNLGATTIAATLFVADWVGIGVMATGGLGGVHRDGEGSLDVSADLEELARHPVVVVCSGLKSVLDQRRTLERLETLGVPVIGWRCDELPGFYTAETGLKVPCFHNMSELCRLIRAHRALRLPTALVVAQPPPPDHAMQKRTVDQLVAAAEAAAAEADIIGPERTPFLLRDMAARSEGATVRANTALITANAQLAGELAVALAATKARETEIA
jgi:pseudouridine-5'-phosphate glycosidase